MKTFEWLSSEELLNDTTWWDIYASSFSPFELDPKESLLSALDKNILKIGRYTQHNITVAISVIQPMHSLPFALLNYFAISKPYRGQSLGSELFLALILAGESFVKEYSEHYLGLIWEAEDPEGELDLSEKKLKQRRIQFYKKHAAHFFHHRFIQPPLDGQHTVLMCLMYHAAHLIERNLEKQIIEVIYFEKYHVVNKITREILLHLYHQCC